MCNTRHFFRILSKWRGNCNGITRAFQFLRLFSHCLLELVMTSRRVRRGPRQSPGIIQIAERDAIVSLASHYSATSDGWLARRPPLSSASVGGAKQTGATGGASRSIGILHATATHSRAGNSISHGAATPARCLSSACSRRRSRDTDAQ